MFQGGYGPSLFAAIYSNTALTLYGTLKNNRCQLIILFLD